jgi:hypothetical protein
VTGNCGRDDWIIRVAQSGRRFLRSYNHTPWLNDRTKYLPVIHFRPTRPACPQFQMEFTNERGRFPLHADISRVCQQKAANFTPPARIRTAALLDLNCLTRFSVLLNCECFQANSLFTPGIEFRTCRRRKAARLRSVIVRRWGRLYTAAAEEMLRIRKAVGSLPERQRTAFELQSADCSYQAVATALGTTAKGAERLVARARAALRATLSRGAAEEIS